MIISRENLNELCKCISEAIDTADTSLSITGEGTNLHMAVTNGEYYVNAHIDTGDSVSIRATVNAQLFIKLIGKLTSDTIEMTVTDSAMTISADGTYKLPLIYVEDEMVEVPEKKIENVTTSFELDKSAVSSILNYNVKDVLKNCKDIAKSTNPAYKLCYIDAEGAISFNSSGACVNDFKTANATKLVLNSSVVNLFKLFSSDDKIKVCYGEDVFGDGLSQTKISFSDSFVTAVADITCDEELINKFPVGAIRGRVNGEYPHTVEIKKSYLASCLDRLLLLAKFNHMEDDKSNKKDIIGTLTFDENKVTIFGDDTFSEEAVYYDSSIDKMTYTMKLNLEDLKAAIDTCTEKNMEVKFGDSKAIQVSHGNIHYVIQERHCN